MATIFAIGTFKENFGTRGCISVNNPDGEGRCWYCVPGLDLDYQPPDED